MQLLGKFALRPVRERRRPSQRPNIVARPTHLIIGNHP
jgi:hypothetical protein